MNKQETYQKLLKKYTPEELAESFIFSVDLPEEEHQQNDKEFWEFRKKLLVNRTKEDHILSGLLQIKYQIEGYLEQKGYDKEKSVQHFLDAYMKVVDKKQKELAYDLDIHPTRISRIRNNKEKLSLALTYRLEAHSGNLIPALFWWKLVQKEIEMEMMQDSQTIEQEKSRVRNVVYQRA